MSHIKTLIALFPVLLLSAGCSFFHNGEAISENIEGGKLIHDSASRLFIKPLSGKESNPDFNDELYRRLKNTINLDGRLAVVGTEPESDLVLGLVVVSYSEQDIRFDSAGRAVTRRISLTLAVTLTETVSGREKVRAKETDSFIVFDTEKSVISETYRDLAEKTSGKVLSIILTGWDSNKSTDKRPVQ